MKRKEHKLMKMYGEHFDEALSSQSFHSSDSDSENSDSSGAEGQSLNASYHKNRDTINDGLLDEEEELKDDVDMVELQRISEDEATKDREELIKESNKKKS